MTKLIAIHEIITTDAKDKRVAIAPGSTFDVSEADAEKLLKVGAAKKATTKGTKEAKAELDAGKKAAKAEPDTGKTDAAGAADGDGDVDLDAMTKAELVAFAKEEYGLDLDEGDKKADLIDAIEKAAE